MRNSDLSINSSLQNDAQLQQSDISQMNPQTVQQINDYSNDNQQQIISNTENTINNPQPGNKKKRKVGPVLAIIAGLIVVVAVMFILFNTVLLNVKQVKKTIEVGSILDLTDVFECKDGVSISIKDASSIDTSSVGNYTITLLIDNGKKVSEKQYDIEVIDTTPPEISASDITVLVGADFIPEEYIAVSDNSNMDVDLNVDVNNVNTSEEGEYSLKIRATDSYGNSSEQSVKVIVTRIDDIQDVADYIDSILEDNGFDFSYEVGTTTGTDCLWVNGNKLVYDEFNNSDTDISIYPFFRCYDGLLGDYFEVREIQINFDISDSSDKIVNRRIYTPTSTSISSSKGSIECEVLFPDYDTDSTAVWKTSFRVSIDEEKIGELNKVLEGDDVKIKISVKDQNDKKTQQTYEISDEAKQSFVDLIKCYYDALLIGRNKL